MSLSIEYRIMQIVIAIAMALGVKLSPPEQHAIAIGVGVLLLIVVFGVRVWHEAQTSGWQKAIDDAAAEIKPLIPVQWSQGISLAHGQPSIQLSSPLQITGVQDHVPFGNLTKNAN